MIFFSTPSRGQQVLTPLGSAQTTSLLVVLIGLFTVTFRKSALHHFQRQLAEFGQTLGVILYRADILEDDFQTAVLPAGGVDSALQIFPHGIHVSRADEGGICLEGHDKMLGQRRGEAVGIAPWAAGNLADMGEGGYQIQTIVKLFAAAIIHVTKFFKQAAGVFACFPAIWG